MIAFQDYSSSSDLYDMVVKWGGRGGNKKENARRRRVSSYDNDDEDDDDSDEEAEEEEGPPLKFVLAGDDTGRGIDYNLLEQESWEKLEEYCKVKIRCGRRGPAFCFVSLSRRIYRW